LAARAGVRPSILDPELYYDVNVVGTLMLLEAMKAANVRRLLFASSSSVYGNNKKVPFSENDNVDFPISPYAATKKAGELLCHTYHNLYGFDIFCLRFFSVYGPRQRPEMAIHNFARKIIDGLPITVFGDGTTKRDYTFIEDIVNGTIAAMHSLKGYEIINLGESKTYSLNTVVALLEKSLSKKAIINKLPVQPGDVHLTNADISKAKSLIGYEPKTNLEEGISKFVSWLVNDRQ
jgi:UDP-glucuronate 4-epimerase